MSFTNINDPAAVKTLLDQLRASQAWQETLSSTPPASEPNGEVPEALSSKLEDAKPQGDAVTRSSGTAPPASVASLLSQLRIPEAAIAINTPPVSHPHAAHDAPRNIPRTAQEPPPVQTEQWTSRLSATPSSTRVQDVRSVSFQQALPHLTQLAGAQGFVASVARLRQEQHELEKQLWEERQAIHKKHEEKVKVARNKATMIGAGLSKHEADMMNDAYRKDLQRFEKERVLLAWDALIQKQQAALEALGVPTMFPTASEADCEKQRRVVQVLEGIVG